MIQQGIVGPLVKNCSDTSSVAGLFALQSLMQFTSHVDPAISNPCILEMIETGAIPRLVEFVLSIDSATMTMTSSINEDTTDPNNHNNNNNNDNNNTTARRADMSWRTRVNLACGLLANITRQEEGAIELVGRTMPENAIYASDLIEIQQKQEDPVLSLQLLWERFVNVRWMEPDVNYLALCRNAAIVGTTNHTTANDWFQSLSTMDKDPFQHVAAIWMNITQIEAGRKFLMRIPRDGQPSRLQKLLPTLLQSNSNPVRRRGIAGAVRNCCLESDSAWWLLNTVQLLTPILYPLAGPEELELEIKCTVCSR